MPNDSKPEEDLGGLKIPSTNSENPGTGSPPGSLSASAAVVEGRKERADKGKTRGPRNKNEGGGISPISAQQFAQLYSPKLWGKVLASPGDAAAVITGSKTWEISPEEKETMGEVGSIAAQCFATQDPRYLAAALAFICCIEIYSAHFLAYKIEKAKEKKDTVKS